MTLDFEKLLQEQPGGLLSSCYEQLVADVAANYSGDSHGRQAEWLGKLGQQPVLVPEGYNLATDTIQLGHADQLKEAERAALEDWLLGFKPWRKGPFSLFGTHIDTEWRSDWKWQRLAPHISDLSGRLVLDVGCGNGYHCWRMRGAGAGAVVGIDPTRLFLFQFELIKRWLPLEPVYLLPLKSEQLHVTGQFDTVFSMGVLYHRRSPADHLKELHSFLRPGGELVLETLVMPGDDKSFLLPEGRYAQMRNVFYLPTTGLLSDWLQQAGFENTIVADVNQTSLTEQRATRWMDFQSLADFLDPDDTNRTVEGHPAPTRAILVAQKQ